MRRFLFVALAAVPAAAFACVGDDAPAAPAPVFPEPSVPETGGNETGTEGGGVDAADGAPPTCSSDDPFGKPTELDGLYDGANTTGDPSLRADELEIFFQRSNQVWVARRGARNLAFEPPKQIDAKDAGASTLDPSISADGLVLYVVIVDKIARMRRPTLTAPFEAPEPIPGIEQPTGNLNDPYILPDQRALYFGAPIMGGGFGIYRSVSVGGAFPNRDDMIWLPLSALHPVVSADDLTLYVSNGGTNGIERIRRKSATEPFGTPAPVGELNVMSATAGGVDRPGWISPDNCRIYLSAGPSETTRRIYVAERKPR